MTYEKIRIGMCISGPQNHLFSKGANSKRQNSGNTDAIFRRQRERYCMKKVVQKLFFRHFMLKLGFELSSSSYLFSVEKSYVNSDSWPCIEDSNIRPIIFRDNQEAPFPSRYATQPPGRCAPPKAAFSLLTFFPPPGPPGFPYPVHQVS